MSHSNPIVETLTLVLSQSSSLETFILKYSFLYYEPPIEVLVQQVTWHPL